MILDHMLLHKLYINVAFANILLHTMSLQNHPGPKYEKKDDIFPKTKKDLVVLTRQCLLRYSRFKELIWEKTRQPDFGYHRHCLKSSFGHSRKSNQVEMY